MSKFSGVELLRLAITMLPAALKADATLVAGTQVFPGKLSQLRKTGAVGTPQRQWIQVDVVDFF